MVSPPSPSGSRRRRSWPTSRRRRASPDAGSSSSTWAAATTRSTRSISYQDGSYYNRRPSIAVPAGQVLQVGTRCRGARAGPASAARGPAEHLQRGASGAGAAHRLSELQPLAFRGDRHLGHGQPAELDRLGLAGALSRYAAAAARRAVGVEHHRRDAARAAVGGERRAGDSPTRPTTTSGAPTRARRRSRSGTRQRSWPRTRRPGVRIWRS